MKLRISDDGLKRIAQTFSPDEGAFRLEELSSEAQERAHERYVQHSTEDSHWYEYVIENAKEDAPAYFTVEDVEFTGFWSQGDGASWTGSIDTLAWSLAHGIEEGARLVEEGELGEYVEVKRRGGSYVHSGSMYLDNASSGYGDRADEIEQEMLDAAREYANQIYTYLEESYDAETSLDNFREMADANGWSFDGDGNLV